MMSIEKLLFFPLPIGLLSCVELVFVSDGDFIRHRAI